MSKRGSENARRFAGRREENRRIRELDNRLNGQNTQENGKSTESVSIDDLKKEYKSTRERLSQLNENIINKLAPEAVEKVKRTIASLPTEIQLETVREINRRLQDFESVVKDMEMTAGSAKSVNKYKNAPKHEGHKRSVYNNNFEPRKGDVTSYNDGNKIDTKAYKGARKKKYGEEGDPRASI